MTAPAGREGTEGPDGVESEGDGFERRGEPRGDRTREWELFLRESSAEPLRHAGSVSAPTAEVAREQATTLFGFAAETLWLCPADETVRFVAEDVALGDRAEEYEFADADGDETADGRAES
ncbi:MAG: Htur_1727 family rSAM-partnered candidate RiPP [Haloarculaceae archaeon]